MSFVANSMIVVIALLHLWFLIPAMFLWTRPPRYRAFGFGAACARQMRALAASQGRCNGLLAAGVIQGLALGGDGFGVKIFFLGCALLAGLVGGLTGRKILCIQALPA